MNSEYRKLLALKNLQGKQLHKIRCLHKIRKDFSFEEEQQYRQPCSAIVSEARHFNQALLLPSHAYGEQQKRREKDKYCCRRLHGANLFS